MMMVASQKRFKITFWTACGLTLSLVAGSVQAGQINQNKEKYFTDAKAVLDQKLAQKPITSKARNVILFVGDGMGVSTVTPIRILEGQLMGGTGEEHVLSWEKFPYTALSKTYNSNQQVPDSAGTASAFLSGTKTKAGVISVNQSVPRGDCAASKGNHLESILELSERAGLNTGIISTARITHATPAASYAHTPEREWENDSEIPAAEKKKGCHDIARQFIDFSIGNGIELAFGGGRREFLPNSERGPEGKKGKRRDGRNLISEWQSRHRDGQYVWNEAGFDKLDITSKGPILGLFNPSHMQYEADRADDRGGEPSLAQMTEKAIQVMQKKDGGYFLYIEAARIDHGHHGSNAYRALHDGIALAQAVEVARKLTNHNDTLIIVTADHSHGFTMSGYATRGNPILGKVVENDTQGGVKNNYFAEDMNGDPYTTLGYYTGPGAETGTHRQDLSNVDTEDKDFKQQALVPTKSEKHGGEDVAIYADGPDAYLFQGVVEQNYIFHVMYHALRLDEKLK